MTKTLTQLQEETKESFDEYLKVTKEKDPDFRYGVFRWREEEIAQFIKQAQLFAYNQGVKDSVEALPEELKVFATGEDAYPTDVWNEGHNHCRKEAINNMNKLLN